MGNGSCSLERGRSGNRRNLGWVINFGTIDGLMRVWNWAFKSNKGLDLGRVKVNVTGLFMRYCSLIMVRRNPIPTLGYSINKLPFTNSYILNGMMHDQYYYFNSYHEA